MKGVLLRNPLTGSGTKSYVVETSSVLRILRQWPYVCRPRGTTVSQWAAAAPGDGRNLDLNEKDVFNDIHERLNCNASTEQRNDTYLVRVAGASVSLLSQLPTFRDAAAVSRVALKCPSVHVKTPPMRDVCRIPGRATSDGFLSIRRAKTIYTLSRKNTEQNRAFYMLTVKLLSQTLFVLFAMNTI
ncbi:hypothetical protein EVAR_68505_1 [Eumeta japonica]|uniref:Uncharacterized protein n=1 Tax=Eumeta variegata TaxID=151549 RepID=A0A4C2A8R5_EUMVA|nr:hypothetical protein EVAR_68505_1 [Eumeta japonica]